MDWYQWDSGRWDDSDSSRENRGGWWNWANDLTVVINYSRLRPVSDIGTIIETTFNNNNSTKFAYKPAEYALIEWSNQTVNDDQGWWALAWLAAYDVTGQVEYLHMANDIFLNMTAAWSWPSGGGLWWNTPNRQPEGGSGLYWTPPPGLAGQYYKNAITNELLFALSAGLSRGDEAFLWWAKAVLNWFDKSGLQNATGLINDGLDTTNLGGPEPTAHCVNNGGATLTYNQGVILGGLADMYTRTSDSSYLDRGWAIFNAVTTPVYGLVEPSSGVLREPGVSPSNDACQWKGIFMRNLAHLYDVENTPERRSAYADFFRTNADSLWNNNRNGNLFGYHWEGPFDDSDSIRQSSALDALVAAIRLDG